MGRRLRPDLGGRDRARSRKVTVTLDDVGLRHLQLIREYYERRVDVGNVFDVSRCVRTALAHLARECAKSILPEGESDEQAKEQ